MMKADAYPLPLLWDQLLQAAHHKYYICLDLNWGFWNLPLHPDSREYTALMTHKGCFEFTVLPFGIKNSPSEFQRMMDMVLGSLYGKGVSCYIDDIAIYANEFDVCIMLLGQVFSTTMDCM